MPLIFDPGFWYRYISGAVCPIGMEQKLYESMRYWTLYMTLTFDLVMILTSDFVCSFWNSFISRIEGSPFIWNFAEMNNQMIANAVNGDMRNNKNMYVYFHQAVSILVYCVISLI